MNSVKVSNFCNEFTFYDHYVIGTGIDLNRRRKWGLKSLSERDFVSERDCIRLLYVVGDLPLMVINDYIEKIVEKTDNLRVAILQTLSLENFKKMKIKKNIKI